MNDSPTIFVIDDDKAVRDSLQWLIESVGLQVKTFENATDFLTFCQPAIAGCIVVDIRLPGMSGLDLQDRLTELGIKLPVIIITGHGDVPVAIRAMKAGAIDFIEKPFSDQVLLDRIRDALRCDAENRQVQAHLTDIVERMERLTPRERQVMELVVQGRLNKQIAADLDLSHKTIEVHRAHVMEKMQATSLAELVRMAVAVESGALAKAKG